MSLLVSCRFAAHTTRDRVARDGLETLYEGQLVRESFGSDCWIARSAPATFELDHDGEVVGQVGAVIVQREWWIADSYLEDTPVVRERVRVGARVSVGARSLRRYEDADLRLVRHEIAILEHIALVGDHQVPGYVGAVITSVRELPKPKPANVEHAPTPPAPVPLPIPTAQPRPRTRERAEMDELNRRLDRLGAHPTETQIDTIIQGMRAEYGYRCSWDAA